MLRHFVPRQLQQTTWLTSTGYCRSKHAHADTDTHGLFRYKPPLVPDTVYARLDGSWGSQICKIPGIRNRGFPESSFFSSFWRDSFLCVDKNKAAQLNTKNGREVGDSFCKWCTELCFHEFFNDQSVYIYIHIFLFCLQKTILFAALQSWYESLLLKRIPKNPLKKTTIMFRCCKHVSL